MVAGNVIPIRQTVQRNRLIRTLCGAFEIQVTIGRQSMDFLRTVVARAGADDIDRCEVVALRRHKDLRHDGVIARQVCLRGVFVIEADIQIARIITRIASPHQHGGHNGLRRRLRRCAGELAAQDCQRAEAARLIVQPPADIHRKVVVRIRRALDYTSGLGLVPIRD